MADFPDSPLRGKRVVITRAERQSAALASGLREKGGIAVSLPLIQIFPPVDFANFDAAIRSLHRFDWIVFTSQNAVSALVDRFEALGLKEPHIPAKVQVAAVGRTTAESAARAGLQVSFIGSGGTASDLVNELAAELKGKSVFLPRSDRAAPALVERLRDLNCDVFDVNAYQTRLLQTVDAATRSAVGEGDAILFFSPSAVQAFRGMVTSGVLSSLRENVLVGAIGPVTNSALREAGIKCDFQALQPTVNEIVLALEALFVKNNLPDSSGAKS